MNSALDLSHIIFRGLIFVAGASCLTGLVVGTNLRTSLTGAAYGAAVSAVFFVAILVVVLRP